MKKILIYHDSGVGPSSFQHLFGALAEYLPQYAIQAVNHRDFLSPGWEQSTALVVFPGGRDYHYHLKLQGAANARLRTYVENGGRFLGICAGAYYGAAYIEFEKGGELEICASRELAFFPGKAIGPIYGNGVFRYDSDVGVRALFFDWEGGASYLHYNGGCFFETPEAFSTIAVVARYQDFPDSPAAVVYCQVGQGAALLSGIHPEYSVQGANSFFQHIINKILII